MPTLKVTLNPDGSTRVDNDMPDGPDCDAEDAKLKAVLELLGVGLADLKEVDGPPRQAEGQGKVKQGGGT